MMQFTERTERIQRPLAKPVRASRVTTQRSGATDKHRGGSAAAHKTKHFVLLITTNTYCHLHCAVTQFYDKRNTSYLYLFPEINVRAPTARVVLIH